MAKAKRHRVGKGKRAKVPSKIAATIAHLKALQAARTAGHPVAYTTDPAWLLDEAINRRAGWVSDPGTRGSAQPVGGKLPRKARGIEQDNMYRTARQVNDPHLYLRRDEFRHLKGVVDLDRIRDRFHERGDE